MHRVRRRIHRHDHVLANRVLRAARRAAMCWSQEAYTTGHHRPKHVQPLANATQLQRPGRTVVIRQSLVNVHR
jgi:hypothetical protein